MGLILSDAEREADSITFDRIGRVGERRNFYISEAKMKRLSRIGSWLLRKSWLRSCRWSYPFLGDNLYSLLRSRNELVESKLADSNLPEQNLWIAQHNPYVCCVSDPTSIFRCADARKAIQIEYKFHPKGLVSGTRNQHK